jgi:uncharacterized DUF497 family protein
LEDPRRIEVLDDRFDYDEERIQSLGIETASGNLLVVVHTWTEIAHDRSAVRIVSARRPTRNEARQYREDPSP